MSFYYDFVEVVIVSGWEVGVFGYIIVGVIVNFFNYLNVEVLCGIVMIEVFYCYIIVYVEVGECIVYVFYFG